ncbi:MAG TPA: LysE family translocator [Acetobacteraceae bacterium]|nr:LysE family translocator [Acetobacteraceae bacterium]
MELSLSTWLIPVAGFAVAMSGTPGPNNAMLAASGASFGFVRTTPHMLGVALGFPLMLLAVALGAGAPLRAWPWLQSGLRWIGIAYLLWLAWHIARLQPDAAGPRRRAGRPLSFLQAAAFQWVNPKAWVAAAGAIVTFVPPGRLQPALLLATVFLVVTMVDVALWTAAGAASARVLTTPRALRRFNLTMALLLVASVLPMLLE